MSIDELCDCEYEHQGLACFCVKPKSEAKKMCADCTNGKHEMATYIYDDEAEHGR